MSVKDPDADLVAQARDGDSGAFAELVERYQVLLTSIAYGMLQEAESSEDVVQEAFVSAWKSLSSYRGDAKFRNWLCRILVNKGRSALRWRRLRRWVRLDAPKSGSDETYVDDLKDMSLDANIERAAVERERSTAVRRAVARLPEQQRTAVLLRSNGLAVAEVAQTMDIAEGTVKAHLHQARQRLKELEDK